MNLQQQSMRCMRKQLMESRKGDKQGKLGFDHVRQAYYSLNDPWSGNPLEGDERRHWEKVIQQRDESRDQE